MKKSKTNNYSRRHKHSAHHKISRRRYNHSHLSHHNRKTQKNRRNRRNRNNSHYREVSVVVVPGSKSVPIFRHTNKKKTELIRLENNSMGNIIPGLRNYLKNV
jgi:hypothetical protein